MIVFPIVGVLAGLVTAGAAGYGIVVDGEAGLGTFWLAFGLTLALINVWVYRQTR